MSRRPSLPARRSLFIDGLKALASVLIVLHHLAFYGPMADVATPLAPGLFGFLADEARMVVQIFLVIGGFMAARSLAPHGRLVVTSVGQSVLQRIVRLAVPYWFALALTVLASAVARQWMDHASISPVPGVADLLLNVLLLAQIAGHESLSAGAWYVAIDLQLFVLTIGLLGTARLLARRLRWSPTVESGVGLSLFGAVALAALFYFNLDAHWDAWALYFVGAYALGAAAWWVSEHQISGRWLLLIGAVTLAALWWEWRDRLALAAMTAATLVAMRQLQAQRSADGRPPHTAPASWASRLVSYLGTTSYALFLVHFPVCLVVNGFFTAHLPATPGWQGLGVLTALAASLTAARFFHVWIEAPAQTLLRSPARAPSGAQAA